MSEGSSEVSSGGASAVFFFFTGWLSGGGRVWVAGGAGGSPEPSLSNLSPRLRDPEDVEDLEEPADAEELGRVPEEPSVSMQERARPAADVDRREVRRIGTPNRWHRRS